VDALSYIKNSTFLEHIKTLSKPFLSRPTRYSVSVWWELEYYMCQLRKSPLLQDLSYSMPFWDAERYQKAWNFNAKFFYC
jgi:hypothetical protein